MGFTGNCLADTSIIYQNEKNQQLVFGRTALFYRQVSGKPASKDFEYQDLQWALIQSNFLKAIVSMPQTYIGRLSNVHVAP
jgi:hypothetical protein